mgnify:FL=1
MGTHHSVYFIVILILILLGYAGNPVLCDKILNVGLFVFFLIDCRHGTFKGKSLPCFLFCYACEELTVAETVLCLGFFSCQMVSMHLNSQHNCILCNVPE